jgi:anti-sigma factor RsiW
MNAERHTTCSLADEELAAFAAGDLPEDRQRTLAAHAATCARCRRRLHALSRVDSELTELLHRPVPEVVLQRALARVRPSASAPAVPEILTLREAAAFLRVSDDELQDLLDELPVFELAGQLRIRTEKLRQWIEQRELAYQRTAFRTRALRITRGAWLKGMAS